MTKFIIGANNTLINLDQVKTMFATDVYSKGRGVSINLSFNEGSLAIHKLPESYSVEKAQELVVEFGILLSSQPTGVFMFNPEFLVKQKEHREQGKVTQETPKPSSPRKTSKRKPSK